MTIAYNTRPIDYVREFLLSCGAERRPDGLWMLPFTTTSDEGEQISSADALFSFISVSDVGISVKNTLFSEGWVIQLDMPDYYFNQLTEDTGDIRVMEVC